VPPGDHVDDKQKEHDMSTTTVDQDFPVLWEGPDEANLPWIFLARNFPDQVTPLEFDVAQMILRGIQYTRRDFDAPSDARFRRINTFVYMTMLPLTDAWSSEARARLRTAMLELGEKWEHQYLPEIERSLEELGSANLFTLSMPALCAHLDTVCARFARLFELHFLILMPAREAMSTFVETYRDLLGGGSLDAYRLLGGLPTKTVECGKALWQLSRLALRTPDVCRILQSEPVSTVVPALGRSRGSAEFLAELDAVLGSYGHRTDSVSIRHESWLENPAPVIATIKGCLPQPESADPALASGRAACEREAAVEAARQRLASYPRRVIEEFETVLAAAQVGSMLSEENTHYINFRGLYELRRVILEVGRRLVDGGMIAGQDDVWLFTLAEVQDAMGAYPEVDLHALAGERRAEMARWAGVQPPPFLGATGPVESASGAGAQPSSVGGGTELGILCGTAGSPGTARGVARVLRSIADADRLRPGEVLVTEQTQPSWTPLFTMAAAVVTDTGGVLNHAAIAAREYGIPAVVGVTGATAQIRDGDVVEVDGETGVVRVDPRG
jgi:phosphohistidine swiveling domain-containing protein